MAKKRKSAGAKLVVGVRLFERDITAVDQLAKKYGVCRSEIVRRILVNPELRLHDQPQMAQ